MTSFVLNWHLSSVLTSLQEADLFGRLSGSQRGHGGISLQFTKLREMKGLSVLRMNGVKH